MAHALGAPPIFFFNRTHVYLHCDTHGNVLEVLNAANFNFTYLTHHFQSNKNLREFFDFGALKDFSSSREGFLVFSSRPDFCRHLLFEQFYTSLPSCVLRISSMGGDRFLGIVYFSDILPQFYPEKTTSILYIDDADRLVGFNQTFYRFFKSDFPEPEGLLQQPVQRFFSPSPRDIQEERTPPFSPADTHRWAPAETLTLAPVPAGGLKPLGPGKTSSSKDGLEWSNERSPLSALGLLAGGVKFDGDFWVEMEFENISGSDPVFLYGGDQSGDYSSEVSPELADYLLGNGGAHNAALLKKNGLIIATRPGYASSPGAVRLTFGKMGPAFYLLRNGSLILSHFDAAELRFENPRLWIALRARSACRLTKITLAPGKSRKAGTSPDFLVKLKRAGGRFFLLNRFYTYDLTTKFSNVSGFFLQDVTPLQSRVEDLSGKYEAQVKETRRLKDLLDENQAGGERLVGTSPALVGLRRKAEVAARADATVLIEGPTGAGKEVLAGFIHGKSAFREGPFVKVDCSTLPPALMESELFGHERGAFTGAVSRKTGLLEAANGGTLFLDEVGNLTLEVQAKLLHFLQDFTITRIGGTEPIPLKLRVVAASNVPLREKIEAATFREDLYYRLCVVMLDVPPLSRRREDLPELCRFFLDHFSKVLKKPGLSLSPGAFRKLFECPWPGNIRQLKNVLHQAVIFSESAEITEDLIALESSGRAAPARAKPPRRVGPDYHVLAKTSPEAFTRALAEHKGNIHHLAQAWGLTRRALYYYLKRKKIAVAGFRGRTA